MSCPGKGCRNGCGNAIACPRCYARLHVRIRERLEHLERTARGSSAHATLVAAVERWLRDHLELEAAA